MNKFIAHVKKNKTSIIVSTIAGLTTSLVLATIFAIKSEEFVGELAKAMDDLELLDTVLDQVVENRL